MIEHQEPVHLMIYAHWWKRAVAYLIDSLVLSIPSLLLILPLLFWFFNHVEEIERTQPPALPPFPAGLAALWVIASLVLTAAPIVYFIVMNGSARGQTLGKRVMDIQVRDLTTGGPIGYGKAAGRYFVGLALQLACYIPGIIDYLFPLWDERRQAIHDKAVGSVVIDLRRPPS